MTQNECLVRRSSGRQTNVPGMGPRAVSEQPRVVRALVRTLHMAWTAPMDMTKLDAIETGEAELLGREGAGRGIKESKEGLDTCARLG